ncbi:MAG TPA: methyltransferase domain-containing protein [Gaiellaceae bacterium]|nr:methyltransferase domain-containing protein [Gaiellaceae bacterium]
MGDLPAAATRSLDEVRESGLALGAFPHSTAKARLVLDLRRELAATGDARLRILDAGCGGRHYPFNLWQPLLPFADRIELTGVDVAYLDETRAKAEEVGFAADIRPGSVLDLVQQFGPNAFDVVVSTQVLEHVPDWPRAVAELAAVLRAGGLLLLTCDSGDFGRGRADRVRLAGKRAYALARRRLPVLPGAGLSGEWEGAPTREALAAAAAAAGLDVELVRHYGLVKEIKGGVGSSLLAFAYEEALHEEEPDAYVPRFRILYLRARRRDGDSSPG